MSSRTSPTTSMCLPTEYVGALPGLKLLRAGATLIATSRFPADAAARYASEADFATWRDRLHLHAIDLRDAHALERFCDFLCHALPRLDIVINNACQTVRRPASYYAHLLPAEERMEAALLAVTARSVPLIHGTNMAEATDGSGATASGIVASAGAFERHEQGQTPEAADMRPLFAQQASRLRWEPIDEKAITWVGPDDEHPVERRSPVASWTPAQLSQLCLTPQDSTLLAKDEESAQGDGEGSSGHVALPAGRLDVNGQQIDLRRTNSWLLKLADVSTPELVEVFAINTLAPFLLNARLQPLLAATAAIPSPTENRAGAAFIVNVSAMEGKFYRHKTANHPHTNMAKAALNMMTRTSAAELAATHRIFMTAVDTGWINDENPRDKAARNAETSHFQTPIDECDAAARVLQPIFEGVLSGAPVFGVFLKDYAETEW